MNKDIVKVLLTQFLTAFADNAILFTIITMVLQQTDSVVWYIPALQASFLLSFVILAPWVGPYADKRPKPSVMMMANVIKITGAGLLLLSIEPLLSYAVVGLGAAIYSPAKFGILPELVSEDDLVKANGWVEGSTILAILSGTLVGAIAAEYSVVLALLLVISLYIVSALIALSITHRPVVSWQQHPPLLPHFIAMMRRLFLSSRARYAILGVSLFWSAAIVLRLLLITWAPLVLLMTEASEIAKLTMFTAFGIALGSILAPKLIPIYYFRRSRVAGILMGVTIILLSLVESLWGARFVLLIIGIAGGLFVVPINAALQHVGHRTIGSGGAVAIQNFFENLAMLVASGFYALVMGLGAGPVAIMSVLGLLVLAATFAVSWNLPADTEN